MNEGPIKDITDRTEEFIDFENNKVKLVILDGNTGKVSLVQMPRHGEAIVEMRKGIAHKVTFKDDNLL